MRVIITGGGTGGHVFPALEVAQVCKEAGATVQYFGSFRGQERKACERASIPFSAFPSEPLYSPRTLRGMKAAFNLARATMLATRAMRSERPDVVFSTGGYSSSPVLAAARRLGVPYVIHEQNAVPGRTNRIFSKSAHAVAVTFFAGQEYFNGCNVQRTGLPVRRAFRGGQGQFPFGRIRESAEALILSMGGSQGANAINEATLATVVRMSRQPIEWLHLSGPGYFDEIQKTAEKLGVRDRYAVRAFLDESEMASAMFSCSVAVCRSGAGTLSELAAFRKPSILIPFPASFGNHQLVNAKEFVDMGAALLIEEKDLLPATLESRILLWLEENAATQQAASNLAEWDCPNASEDILKLIQSASKR